MPALGMEVKIFFGETHHTVETGKVTWSRNEIPMKVKSDRLMEVIEKFREGRRL